MFKVRDNNAPKMDFKCVLRYAHNCTFFLDKTEMLYNKNRGCLK